MNEFKINEFLCVKLKTGQTSIYVNGEHFTQCKCLLLTIPLNDTVKLNAIDSIDDAAETLGWTNDGQVGINYNIDPETEFWGHCSNLQAWFENDYDTRILHSNLAFPLLKKLAEVGDPHAKKVFKEEIAKRIETGYLPVITYLFDQGYIKLLNVEEIKALNIGVIIEWILSEFSRGLDTEIYEYLNKMGDIIIKPIFEKLKQAISEKNFRFIYPFISYECVKILPREILSGIFWTDETRYLESIVDIAITQKTKYVGEDLISIVEKIGGESLNLIAKILKLPFDDEWDYLPKLLENVAPKIYESLRAVFFGMLENNEEIPKEYLIIFFKVLLRNLRKKELEEVITKSNIIETILKPDFYAYYLIDEDPLELIMKIDSFLLKNKFIEFFLSPNNEVIFGIAKHYGFKYLLEKKILSLDDWKIIIENPAHNFFQVLTNARDHTFLRENLKPLAPLIKEKIIESFSQNNVNAIRSIVRLDLFFYFSEKELESLTRRFFKTLLNIENASKPHTIRKQMKFLFDHDVIRYENLIYEFLEEEHNALSMLNVIEMLQGEGYLRYLNDSRLREISKSNLHIKLLLEQLSHKRTDIAPKLANILNEIEKILKLKFRKREPDEINRYEGYPLPLQFSIKNNKVFFLKITSCKLDNELLVKVFEFIEEVSLSLEILVLNNNLISTLPESIGNLTSLEDLSLGSNFLSSLPESIGNLQSLKKINLKDNKIKTLPYSIGNLEALEVLLLNRNNIRKLPESMGHLRSLNHLSLERNPILNLPDTMESLTNLEYLDISNTNIKQFPHFMNKIDSFRSVVVSPSYRDNMIGLRKLVHPFKNNSVTVSFGFNYDSHFHEAYPNYITMKDLFYGKYTNHI